jgi:hypothetical protein
MFTNLISHTYKNIPEILAFMTFNQTVLYGDMRGFIVLLGLFINFVFYIILNTTTQLIYPDKTTGIPSINTQFLFFYIGFHLSHMISNSKVEFTPTKAIYLTIIAMIAIFIKSVVGAENVSPDDNSPGRVLGAITGFIIGAFYYTLVNYKYNYKGEDKYNKSYKICKGGEKYKCKVNDYDKIKDDALKDQAKLAEEVKKEESILDDIWKYECDTCDKKI